MSTASQLRLKVIGDWEVLHRVPDPDREVYTAKRNSDGVMGVLVVVQSEGRAADDLEWDVKRCRQLEHPAIAKVLDDFNDDKGRKVIAYEHIEGTSLLRLMKYFSEKGEGLGDRAILHIGAQVVEALAAAHQARDDNDKVVPIVHGQLGPHQILMSWEGDVKVSGLGMASAFGGAEDEPEWLLPYMAPEVREGGPMTARANVYTVGALLWTLFSRDQLPVDGARPAPLRRTRPDLPASITFPIDRAMETANKRISAKALAVSIGRTLEDADREELRWAMEVCRVRVAVEEELVPQESFPPKKVKSARAMSSRPPDSDWPTERMDRSEVFEQARVIGPLPWDKKKAEGTDVIDAVALRATKNQSDSVEDEETTDKGDQSAPEETKERKRKIPRPSKSRRPPRRRRTSSNTQTSVSPQDGALPVPTARRRAITKRGLQELIAPPSMDELVTLRPASAERTVVAVETAEAPSSGSHIVDAGYQSNAPRASSPAASSDAPPDSSRHGPPSYHHPASQYPPSQYPHGPPPASGGHVPYSYAPAGYAFHSQPPGSQFPAVYATAPPTKWIVTVAVTAVTSFAAGLFMAALSGMQMQVGENAVAAAPTQPPAPQVSTAAPAPKPPPEVKPEPAPEPKAAPEPEPEPEPEAEAEAEPEDTEDAEPSADGDDEKLIDVDPSVVAKAEEKAKGLRMDVGLLLVRTSEPNAWVYVGGRPYSKAGIPFEVVCGPHHVRLGDEKRTIWYDPGQSLTVACQGLTDVKILPRPGPPPGRRLAWPPPALRKGQFLK